MKLNYKQKKFVAEYLKEPNATQAAINAGYSKNILQSRTKAFEKSESIEFNR